MRISVHVSPELQAALTRIRELPAESRKQVRRWTKSDALPIWQESVNANVQTRVEALVIGRTARVAVTDKGVRLQAARVGKPLSGGLNPKTQWHAVEFGGEQDVQRTVTSTSRKGKSFEAKRHTQRQLRPRLKAGYVAYPAVAAAVPRIAALWVQTVVRTGRDALEGH